MRREKNLIQNTFLIDFYSVCGKYGKIGKMGKNGLVDKKWEGKRCMGKGTVEDTVEKSANIFVPGNWKNGCSRVC